MRRRNDCVKLIDGIYAYRGYWIIQERPSRWRVEWKDDEGKVRALDATFRNKQLAQDRIDEIREDVSINESTS